MQRPGILNDGLPITYASGIHVESFHGLPYIEHTGAVPGFRSDLLIFPEQKLSVILLANTDGFDPAALAFEIARVYISVSFKQPKLPEGRSYRPTPAALAGAAATYELLSGTSQRGPGRLVTFTTDGSVLRMSGETEPLIPARSGLFFSKLNSFTVRFLSSAPSLAPYAVLFRDSSGTQFAARRVEKVADKQQSVLFAAKDYAGFYYSADLQTTYVIRANGLEMTIETPRGISELKRLPGGHFSISGDIAKGEPAGSIEFTVSESGTRGFRLTMSGKRAADIVFERIAADPAPL